MVIAVKCRICDKQYFICANEERYIKWQHDEHFIQDLMPDLTPGERELLISGTCEICWNEMFEEDEDGEENY